MKVKAKFKVKSGRGRDSTADCGSACRWSSDRSTTKMAAAMMHQRQMTLSTLEQQQCLLPHLIYLQMQCKTHCAPIAIGVG